MGTNPKQIGPEMLCINTDKVYDWVILQANINNTITAADLGVLPVDPCDPAVTNLTTECYLVDAAGNRLPPNQEIAVMETNDRQDRTFLVDGKQVLLQKVTFQSTVNVVVEIRGLNGTTPFVEQTAPIPIEIPESIFLCAPEGTDLIVRLSDIECNVVLNCAGGALGSVDVSLNLCQSVQTVTNVTVELPASFCQPREVFTEQCSTPIIPAQCPVVFPG
ncbi:hypothetical protein [Pseudogracilibacillus sp. SO30301A]|uniref:hypothetical protein n=1 Tax=Pseudogracilibacillus sp. SO30301A TaxID=3098291 RepID=UPI00300E5FB2